MTAVTVVSLTLLTWMVSEGTWLRPHQGPDLSEYEHIEETDNLSSHENPENSELLTCKR